MRRTTKLYFIFALTVAAASFRAHAQSITKFEIIKNFGPTAITYIRPDENGLMFFDQPNGNGLIPLVDENGNQIGSTAPENINTSEVNPSSVTNNDVNSEVCTHENYDDCIDEPERTTETTNGTLHTNQIQGTVAEVRQEECIPDANTKLSELSCEGDKLDGSQRKPIQNDDFFTFTDPLNYAGEPVVGKSEKKKSLTDFFQGDVLTSCEKLGTKNWSVFAKQLGSSKEVNLWDASWNQTFRVMIGLDKELSRGVPIYGDINFEPEEQKFLKACKGEGIKNLREKAQASVEAQNLVKKVELVGQNIAKKLAEHRKDLERCEALVFLTEKSDYDKEYPLSDRSGKTIKQSFDKEITCVTYGPEAQDYKTCTSFIDTYDAATVAKMGLNAGQGIHYQGQTMDRQSELQRQGATGGIDHRGALGAQKDDIKDRANYATQNAVLDSAKLAALYGILESMPKRADLVESCARTLQSKAENTRNRINDRHQRYLEGLFASLGLQTNILPKQNEATLESILPTKDQFFAVGSSSAHDLCKSVTFSNGAETLIMNDQMRSKAKQILAKTAVEAAASYAAAGMLNKQARTIDDLLKRIEGYDPSDDFVAPDMDLLAGPCAFDPSAPGCLGTVPVADRAVGFGNTSLTLGGTGFGSSGTILDVDSGYDNAVGNGPNGSDRTSTADNIGAILPDADKSSDFVDPAMAAARMKDGSASGGVGGGAGSPSAIGSTGNGGGSNGQQAARGGQADTGKKLDYANSSIGRLSGGRGVGRKPASKDEAANPFANMFKKGGPGNETLNFRGPAGIGNKQGNIFDQISTRYQVVQGKNRLLEYKLKDQ